MSFSGTRKRNMGLPCSLSTASKCSRMKLVLIALTVMSAVTGSGEVHRGCKFSMTNLMLTERLGDSGTIEDDTRTWSPVILVPDESGTFLSAICSGRGPDSSWPPIGASGVVLEMGGNGMEKFPDVPDAVKAKVLRLTASGGLIAGLSAELDGYKQLRALDFSGNRIRNISDRAFSGAQHILKLDLSGNEIGSVGKWASHPSLLHLNLAGNEISALLPESLEGLKNLAYLDLSNNLLTKLPDNFGSALTKLKHLHVAGNKFVSVPRLTRSLFLLNLSSNYLESLVLPQIDDLFVLDISRNNLHDLDNVYEQLSLKVLKAGHNNLSRTGKWKCDGLIFLDLSYNNFSLIPEEVNSADLPNLRELYFDGNPLQQIQFKQTPTPFLNLDALGLSKLEKVSRIDQDTFRGIIVQSYVNCSEETGVFVNLSGNQIKQIHPDAFRNYPICSVDLSRNLLNSIPETLFNWRNSRMVDLQDNPWDCNCDLQWMLNKYLPHFYTQRPESLFELRCASPSRFKNRMLMYWYNSTEEIFCKGPSYIRFEYSENKYFEMWTVSTIVCVVLGILIFLLTIAIVVLLILKPKRKNAGASKERKRGNRRSKLLFREIRDNPNIKYSGIVQDACI